MSAESNDYLLTKEDLQDIHYHVSAAVRRMRIHEMDREDAKQELIIYLNQALHGFQSGRSGWNTYRRILISSKLTKIIRKTRQPSSYEQRRADFSIEDFIPMPDGQIDVMIWKEVINQDGIFADGTEKTEETERLNIIMDVQEAIATLPRRLKQLCHILMYSDGISMREAARKLRIDRRTLYIWRQELKRHFVAFGFETSN